MDTLDPNENPEGYILHLEDLLRDRQRIIKDLEWKLKEVDRRVTIQEECAKTAIEVAERIEAQRANLFLALTQVMTWISNWSPPFVYDDEWPETEKMVKRALDGYDQPAK
jgi:hypothetical protein